MSNVVGEALQQVCKGFGYAALSPEQETAIRAFVDGRDVFVMLPTGSGKSLCYTALPSVFDILRGKDGHIVIVVSPLVALMKDQILSLKAKGVRATSVHRDGNDKETFKEIKDGKYQVVYMSPESLIGNLHWREMLRSEVYNQMLVAVAVDEAHCIPKWGDSFRREFTKLGEVRSLIPAHVNVMALTATASVTTRQKIFKVLGMKKPDIVSVVPNRPNVTYWVREKKSIEDVFSPVVQQLLEKQKTMAKMIVFCRTYDDCVRLYRFFQHSLGKNFTFPIGAPNIYRYRLVDMYTNPTKADVKNAIVESFCKVESTLRVVICTVAFGMGVDCPDVRQIVHWGPSQDVEMYIQESGRAGRDGKPSCAILFTNYGSDLRNASAEIIQYCKQKHHCRRLELLFHFDINFQAGPKSCSCCDVCASGCNCIQCCCLNYPIH